MRVALVLLAVMSSLSLAVGAWATSYGVLAHSRGDSVAGAILLATVPGFILVQVLLLFERSEREE